jgi:hypothetical protein
MDELHKKLNKFKIKSDIINANEPKLQTLEINDISLDGFLPNNKIFQLDPNKLKIKARHLIKSHFKTKTNDKYYKRGLIGNTFFNKPTISLNTSDGGEKTRLMQWFSTSICGYNWLLSFNIFLHYTSLSQFQANTLDFIKTKEVRLLNIGNGDGGFISGMYYYFINSVRAKTTKGKNHLQQYDLKWIGFDINNNSTNSSFNNLIKKINTSIDPESCDIIHGFTSDDILEYKNLMYIKTTVENKFGDVNFLYNNIKPRMLYKKNKIMLSILVLSLYVLNVNGLMVTKILEPEYWDDCFIDYLILVSLIFNKAEIFRFPVNKNKKTYYRYYLVGCGKKNLVYNSILGRKLMFVLNNDSIEHPKLISDIVECEEIHKWKQTIKSIQTSYINDSTDPNIIIQKNINQLRDII